MYNSSSDGSVPSSEYQPTVDAFNGYGPPSTFTWINTGGDHTNVWTTAYTDLVNPAGSALQTWLFAQQRAAATAAVIRRYRERQLLMQW
jgi:hypothetical protein